MKLYSIRVTKDSCPNFLEGTVLNEAAFNMIESKLDKIYDKDLYIHIEPLEDDEYEHLNHSHFVESLLEDLISIELLKKEFLIELLNASIENTLREKTDKERRLKKVEFNFIVDGDREYALEKIRDLLDNLKIKFIER